jgi:hypothetical protein
MPGDGERGGAVRRSGWVRFVLSQVSEARPGAKLRISILLYNPIIKVFRSLCSLLETPHEAAGAERENR